MYINAVNSLCQQGGPFALDVNRHSKHKNKKIKKSFQANGCLSAHQGKVKPIHGNFNNHDSTVGHGVYDIPEAHAGFAIKPA